MSKKEITLSPSVAPIPIDVCGVSNCFATHSCGMSSRARADDEDRVFGSLCRILYLHAVLLLRASSQKLQRFYIINTKSNKHKIAVSKQEIY